MKIKQKSIYYAIVSNMFEYYNLSLFLFLSPILTPLFFNPNNKSEFIIYSTFIFSTGFILRPVGALYLGTISDKLGRKRALFFSTLLIFIPSLIIGLLPIYATAGVFSAYVLIFCRLIQGIGSASRESGTVILISEYSKNTRQGFNSSLINISSLIGVLISAIVCAFCFYYKNDWNWRIPFIIGTFLGILAYFMRKNLAESEPFQKILEKNEIFRLPIFTAIKTNLISCFKVFGISGTVLTPFYISIVYINNIAQQKFNLSNFHLLIIDSIVILALILIMPIFGILSDRIGKKELMRIGAYGLIFSSYIIFYNINEKSTFQSFFISQALLTIFGAMCAAPSNAIFSELFPVNQRSSGSSFFYSLGVVIFSGLTPLIIALLQEWDPTCILPALYLALICSIGLISLTNSKV